ncbi:MAG: regulatory signaling modulator protein AmpE [Pseudohongiella sp.]|nr:regulatory signaling modulator protein AmpE [Pseudohongiella sp.]
MTFFVVLSCLLLNHYWRKERLLPVDNWFEHWQQILLAQQYRLPDGLRQWPLTLPILFLLIPLIPVALVLLIAEGRLMGLLTLGLHFLLLMYCLPRVNIDVLIEEYLQRWDRGNYEAAYLHTVQVAPSVFNESFDDYARMHVSFSQFVLVTSFRRIFAVLFWYILFGPLGALFYLLLQQLIATGGLLQTGRSDAVAERLLAILEWVPVRMVALAFALAGDFVATFKVIKSRIFDQLDPDSGLDLLKESAAAAMMTSERVGKDIDFAARASAELRELRGLLMRTHVVWVVVLALIILVV